LVIYDFSPATSGKSSNLFNLKGGFLEQNIPKNNQPVAVCIIGVNYEDNLGKNRSYLGVNIEKLFNKRLDNWFFCQKEVEKN
jgi:hypothetical protein